MSPAPPFEAQRHRVLPGAVPTEELNSAFPRILAAFEPHVVRYGNTNPNISKADGSHGESVEWRVSCYMEVSHDGGARQKHVKPSAEMLSACRPLLERCDAIFSDFYRSLHGKRSIRRLVRMQSFVTRYRPNPQEAGLLRHIDGANVDGSIILALTGADGSGAPIDVPFTGGGVTVWERQPSGVEAAFHHPMLAGDVCALDNYVWHQGNPIRSGERWALVVFYQTKGDNRQHRLANIVLQMAKQVKQDEAVRAAAEAEAARTAAEAEAARAQRAGALRIRLAMGCALGAAAAVALLTSR